MTLITINVIIWHPNNKVFIEELENSSTSLGYINIAVS